MPMHDWSKIEPGTYHDFHYAWIGSIRIALNTGILPSGYIAMAEQYVGSPEVDLMTLKTDLDEDGEDYQTNASSDSSGVLTMPKPVASYVFQSAYKDFARKLNRIVIRKGLGKVVAVIELVSPGNKHSQHEMTSFIEKAQSLIDAGIHLLIIDPFPPTKRDPEGVHQLIWENRTADEFTLPPEKRLVAASYDSEEMTAYIEPFAVGQELPTMPLFLRSPYYVNVPLEATYQTTWNTLPKFLQNRIAAGRA